MEIGVPITGVKSFDAYVGGCLLNVSVGTRRLGLRSALLTAVGTDQVGDFVLALARQFGPAGPPGSYPERAAPEPGLPPDD